MKVIKWRAEYTITFLVCLTLILLLMPTSIKSNFQANLITRWKDSYNKLIFAQDAILKQEQSDILTSFKRANTPDEREDLFIQIFKPYFRLGDKKISKFYKVKYMNGSRLKKEDELYIEEYFYTDNHMIVGIKDIPDDDKGNTIFIVTFDVNGTLPPNRWGKDVFGAKIYSDKVRALGEDMSIELQQEGCNINSLGLTCSNYYLIGGDFND